MSDCGCEMEARNEQERKTLLVVLGINAFMFVFELALGLLAQSTGLIADSLDMLADAYVYTISLYAVGRSEAIKNKSAKFSGFAQIFLALLVLADALRRFFLGSENDIRGYHSRSIGPVAPFDTYVTTRNVVLANNAFGTADTNHLIDPRTRDELVTIGQLTGAAGNNPALYSRNFRFIGGDTQMLANVEYRIPIFGPATLALFADIGSVFNLRNAGTQQINSEFLEDEKLLGGGRLTALGLINTPVLEQSFGRLLYYRGLVMTRTDFFNEF